MYFTGFADEAGASIETQIKATKELGWEFIEARGIDGKNIHDLDENAFLAVKEKLAAAGVRVNCFGSAIANWGKRIDQPFDSSLAEAERSIKRMRALGTKLVRIMSFAELKNADGSAAADQMEAERFRRVRDLHMMFADNGMTAVHENCMNYGGMSWQHTMRLLEHVPELKLVFDTGNPIFTDDRARAAPFPKQSPWEFYQRVRDHVAYIHIKDGYWDHAAGKMVFTHAGEGEGDVHLILQDLLSRGYEGGISIEPHLAVVAHKGGSGGEAAVRYTNYVEYGRRLMAMIERIKKTG